MEQHIILVMSIVSAAVAVLVLVSEKRRLVRKEIRKFIVEKIDKNRYSLKQSYISGDLFYASDKEIYCELKEMTKSLGKVAWMIVCQKVC
jgi:hypothetical protein